MGDLLTTGIAHLHDQIRRHASSLGTYQRGAYSVSVLMTKSQRQAISSGDQRAAVSVDSFDFIVKPSELILNGSVITPMANDKITHGGNVFVVSPIDNDQCYRPSGTDGTRIRVHTVLSA